MKDRWRHYHEVFIPAHRDVVDFECVYSGPVKLFIDKDGLHCIPKEPKIQPSKFHELFLL